MNIDLRLPALILGLGSLSGCVHGTEEVLGLDPTWGEANRRTMAAQVIDPEPDYTFQEMETSADHAAKAVERYRSDEVKQPPKVDIESREISGR